METQTFSRRDFLRRVGQIGAGVAGVTVLAACAVLPAQPADSAAGPAAATAEIVYFDVDESGGGEAAFKVYTDEVIPAFMEQHPDIKVTFQPGIGEWSDMLLASMAAGTAPDVFANWGGFGRKLMEDGQMLPMQDYFTPDDLEDFLEEQLIAMWMDSQLFALPKYISSMAFAYNKDMLDEAGVSYPDDTWTWDTLLAALDKTAELESSELGKRFGYNVNVFLSHHWVWQAGGEWMNERFEGTKILIDEPDAMLALKYLHDLIFEYGYAPTAAQIEGMEWPQAFASGRFAFVEGHSWQISEWLRSLTFNWDYALLPSGPVTHAGGVANDQYSAYAKTAYPEATLAFMRHITSTENELHMMRSIHGWQPSRKSAYGAWDTESAGAQAGKNVAAFSKILEYSRQQPYFVRDDEVRQIFNPLWEQIWITGDLSLEEGVTQIATRVNEFLATVV